MSKNKKSDLEKFIKLYSKLGVPFTIRATPNDEVASYSFESNGDSLGSVEFLFDEDGMFICQNFFCESN